MESNIKLSGLEMDEPEAVVLLGMGSGESHKGIYFGIVRILYYQQEFLNLLILSAVDLSSATPEFIDELEEIIGNTDKLFVRESQPAIPGNSEILSYSKMN